MGVAAGQNMVGKIHLPLLLLQVVRRLPYFILVSIVFFYHCFVWQLLSIYLVSISFLNRLWRAIDEYYVEQKVCRKSPYV